MSFTNKNRASLLSQGQHESNFPQRKKRRRRGEWRRGIVVSNRQIFKKVII